MTSTADDTPAGMSSSFVPNAGTFPTPTRDRTHGQEEELWGEKNTTSALISSENVCNN